jgi:hypothetical protein
VHRAQSQSPAILNRPVLQSITNPRLKKMYLLRLGPCDSL